MIGPRLPHSIPLRAFSSTARASRDLGAKYRRPPSFRQQSRAPMVHPELPMAPLPTTNVARDTDVVVAGVRIPPKPIVPGDEACCMSGCVHCVLTIYAADLEEYNEAIVKAKAALEKEGVPREKWPKAVTEGEGSVDEPAKPVDPTMAAFMELELKLRKK